MNNLQDSNRIEQVTRLFSSSSLSLYISDYDGKILHKDIKHPIEEEVEFKGTLTINASDSDLLSSPTDLFTDVVIINQEHYQLFHFEIDEELFATLIGYIDPIKSHDSQYFKELGEDLKAIFDSSYDVIYVSDNEGNTLRVSQSCERLWGKKREELIGRNVRELEKENVYSPSVTRLVLERNAKVSSIQTTHTGRRLMVVGTPIRNKIGAIERVVNASRDITEITKMQDEVQEMRKLIEGYRSELQQYRKELHKETKIVANSSKMKQVIKLADRIANVESTVLIHGESGVGKEVICNYIHQNSHRHNKPFVKINCGAIPENLLESELFGYVKGAFTGANKEGKMGVFEQANGGTILLDEIGEMNHSLQVRLLRVLQERKVIRVGGAKPLPIDVRILTATNRDLLKEVNNGNFREDLYYRLNVVPISIPPLRERKKDVEALLQFFLDFYNHNYARRVLLSEDAKEALLDYSWPGNVRELQNMIERIVVMNENTTIEPQDLPVEITSLHSSNLGVTVQGIVPHKQCMEEAEKQLLLMTRKKYRTLTKMAQALEVNPSTISRKLNKYNIKEPSE
ncbi:sigma-54-dependent Fis family transcriptional regulator [Alteribacillus sp. YIM 98480]|uniref:sigma-54 interaction domain-containing protein n=1 Tax=Alteribacillus sp. YIM 98480 TaxID=2606599 RepID=UPI00131CC3CF|nr:sigma 54-interacting transcriptional regulator [Alteribacillus sp. YIM 98480]